MRGSANALDGRGVFRDLPKPKGKDDMLDDYDGAIHNNPKVDSSQAH